MINNSRKNGFTLIELLVVVLIIGITISLVSVSSAFYHNKDQELQQAAIDFKLLVDYAQQEAIVGFTEIGLKIVPEGYRFMRYQINKENTAATWVTINNDSVLGTYLIPSGTLLHIVVSQKISQDAAEPQIILSSNGDVTPFAIEFSMMNRSASYRVTADANGKVMMTEIRKRK